MQNQERDGSGEDDQHGASSGAQSDAIKRKYLAESGLILYSDLCA